jgi:hypothetical protein
MVRCFPVLCTMVGGTMLSVLVPVLSCAGWGSQCCGEEKQQEYSGNLATAGFHHGNSPEQAI